MRRRMLHESQILVPSLPMPCSEKKGHIKSECRELKAELQGMGDEERR